MKRVLITGMSGTGKSSVVNRLAELGYRAIDTDRADLTVQVRSSSRTERLWREDQIQRILSANDTALIFLAGACRNQVNFYPQFDHIVLLSAPVTVLIDRLTTRSNNPYGKSPDELAEPCAWLRRSSRCCAQLRRWKSIPPPRWTRWFKRFSMWLRRDTMISDVQHQHHQRDGVRRVVR